MADAGFPKNPVAGQTPEVFILPAGLGFFLVALVGGDEEAEFPKVKERDKDEATVAPKLDPDRISCLWSGELARETTCL
jgi:hypothetical protein